MPNENARSEKIDDPAANDETGIDAQRAALSSTDAEEITELEGHVGVDDEVAAAEADSIDAAADEPEPLPVEDAADGLADEEADVVESDALEDDALEDDALEDEDTDVEDADAADVEDADDDLDEDEDDDAGAETAPATAKGATAKRTKKKDAARGASKATSAKREATLTRAERKAAEKARIERSKEIAAKARGKGGKRDAATDTASMTKEQLRYSQPKTQQLDDVNPVWFKPIMFGFLLLGFAWILVYYLSTARLPIAELGDWNLLIGIGIALVGFLMMTNWK